MKKYLYSLFLTTILSFILAIPSFAATTTPLPTDPTSGTPPTAVDIQSKLIEIGQKYKVGDLLSTTDANFIKLYASSQNPVRPLPSLAVQPNGTSTGTFNRYYSRAGRTIHVQGSCYSTLGWINNSFGGHCTTTITYGRAFNSITNYVYTVAYGLAGQGGIGKVYDGHISSTTYNSKSNTLYASRQFVASVAYDSTWATVTLHDSSGTYSVGP